MWVASATTVQVSALHPLMADLARQVGGERVRVFDLVGAGGNPHRFEPRPADMAQMRESVLVLAAGKNLEPYLGRLRESLVGVTIIEVGQTLPSLTAGEEDMHSHGPTHGAGSLDPHWWHGISNMSRAVRVVAAALEEKDPDGKAIYQENARAYMKKLETLTRWAKTELAKVPRNQRKLVTAHNAFAYFAHEFGFQVIAVAGLNQEQATAPKELAATLEAVRNAGVAAVFPETKGSSKSLESISKETGAKIAEPLIADGNGTGSDAGFEGMIRHNVTAITQALAAP
jgi:ABC-type Zn uptake system ZnuABC Zn-binding protein ZnuA